MVKKVPINLKSVNTEPSVDSWVETRSTEVEPGKTEEAATEKMKRLTIDVTETLHRAIKMRSVEQGVTMADLVRDLLEEKFL